MYTVKYANVVVKLSDGSLIKGKVNIGEKNRLSDFLRHSQEQFMVTVSQESSEDSNKVFFVNKNYIVWAGTGN
jgi:hypothetical protein